MNIISLDPELLILFTSLNPLFITGIIDAEGSFSASISKNPLSKLGFTIGLRFNITMHKRDSILVKNIRAYFKNIGVYKETGSFCYFDVNSIADLNSIIEHFRLFPLISSKRNAFYIFKHIHSLLKVKYHLRPEGFKLIVAFINILNHPINNTTINNIILRHGTLPNLILPPVLLIKNIIQLNPWWIAGFVCGEGSFTYYKAYKILSSGRISTNIQMGFECSQDTRDSYLLTSMLYYFGTGKYYKGKTVSRIRITPVLELQHIITPVFIKYPVSGFKQEQYNIWLRAVTLMIIEPHSVKRNRLLGNITDELTALRLNKA